VGLLGDALHGEQELVAASRNDRVVQRKVPDLELSGVAGRHAAFEASPHLIEVTRCRPRHDERQHLWLDDRR
jgi:hypothetical protein